MRLLTWILAIPLGFMTSPAAAQETLTVDGTEYTLAALTANCQNLSDQPQAMIACFNALSQLMEQQSGNVQSGAVGVLPALNNLRTAAQVQGADTGLMIAGTGCSVQFVYYANYYHLSRRNVSEIDLFSAQFDASKLQFETLSEMRAGQAPLFSAKLDDGASAVMQGGAGLSSAANDFPAKPGRMDVGNYALQIINSLETREDQTFEMVLVHPDRSNNRDSILDALEMFVNACKA